MPYRLNDETWYNWSASLPDSSIYEWPAHDADYAPDAKYMFGGNKDPADDTDPTPDDGSVTRAYNEFMGF